MARYLGERKSTRLLGFARIWGAKAVAFDVDEPFTRLPVCLYSGSRTCLREGYETVEVDLKGGAGGQARPVADVGRG